MPTLEQAKNWYNQSDPVHGFDHIQRVYRMAEHLAQAEGADLEIVRAAALLHDAEGPLTGDSRAVHQLASAEFARQILQAEGWPEARIQAVEHCIRAHRFRDEREQPETIEAQVLFDADKLDAIGAIGALRSIAYAILDGQNLFVLPSEQFRQTGEKLPGEPHTPYHEHLFKLRKLKDRMFTPTGKALAQARHDYLEGFFAQLHAELRAEA
ncbi:MAG TPA: HD domain-containing protein [Chloroflexi bacterium]|nr:HD domain-containing protein [Chloroflexota bacterium]HBY07047.1 HD domain-containing protein [Chloroflexota bacterium]